MNVFLDAQPLLGGRSGIARYVECLYSYMHSLEDLECYLAFNRIAKPIEVDKLVVGNAASSLINIRYPYKVIRRLMKPNPLYTLPYDLFAKQKADIFHGTNFTMMPTTSGKSVITIHDLAFMKYPETTSEKIYRHHMKWVPYSAQQSEAIIAISEHTKKDIIELLGIPEEKIHVIPLAADDRFAPLPREIYISALDKYALPENYILFVGTLEPRKNLLGLLKAFNALKQNADVKEKLVIVGAKGWKYSAIFDYIQKNGLQNEVIFTGFIADDDLVSIYNGASLFVMPSVYEGFGIPILEAMQCGVPVIGSNVSSIPEIICDYGLLASPHEPIQWVEAMLSLLTDDTVRMKYSRLSLERSGHFSWARTALETKNLYNKVLSL